MKTDNLFLNLEDALPGELKFDYNNWKLPELSGSEKQVDWANKIRAEIMHELFQYAVNFRSDGRASAVAEIYLKGKAAMVESIRGDELINSITNEEIKSEKIEAAIEAFNDTKARIERVYDISTKTSAKWWIDHRTNQLANYLNKKLKAYVDGKGE